MLEKNLSRIFIFLFLLSVFISCSEPTQPVITLTQKLNNALDLELEQHNGIGASVAVLMPGQNLWRGTSGISYSNVPVEPDMIFGIGSITKNFIATIILQLAEEGILTVNDSLYKWLPHFTNIDSTITIRQLLNHTSGIYDFTKNPDWGASILANLNRIVF